MLTDTKIKNLKPSDKCTPNRPDKYSDKQGLQLWVRKTGTKTWVSAYRLNGKQQSLTLGKYPSMPLAEARQANTEIKSSLAKGVDPKLAKKQERLDKRSQLMFNEYALQWLELRKSIVRPNTFKQDNNRLHKDVLPAMKGLALKEVTFEDCRSMAEGIEARKGVTGKPPREATRRTIALVESIFKRARIERLTLSNPADGLKEVFPKHKSEHMKHVDLDELPQLLRDIDNYHGHAQTRLGIQFLAYSFCRTIELRMMKWSDIDFINKLWRVDIENLKIARRHVVPLSNQMLEILHQMKDLTGTYDYVFFNTGTHKPYSEVFINNALDVLGYAGKQTGHGFRHIASTNLNELGFMGDAIEKQLAHDKKNSIRAVYNHAQHLEERRQIMQVWADFLDLLKKEGGSVELSKLKIRLAPKDSASSRLSDSHITSIKNTLIDQGLSQNEIDNIINKLV